VRQNVANKNTKEKVTLQAQDFDGHKLFTQILMFFKSDNNQFTTLRVLLHKLYKETKNIEEVKEGAEMNMVIKLNMKLIQLLQVIETIYI